MFEIELSEEEGICVPFNIWADIINVVTSELWSSYGDWFAENTDYYQFFVHQAAIARKDKLLKLTPVWVCKNI